MKRIHRKVVVIMVMSLLYCNVWAQVSTNQHEVNELSLEQIKGMTQEELLQLPFENLISLVEKFKLSSVEELYALLLNPTQSTASKKEENLFKAPLATTVITAKELEISGARSIPEALRLAPGVIVREKTNGNYDVHIRGNDFISPGSDISNSVNSTTLVMIDNRPVYNSFLGATFWENLPVAIGDIEKIEIISGPSAALYGPNAVSGVIHLITKKSVAEGWKSNATIQAGNNNTQIGHLSSFYSKNKWGASVSANYQNANRFQDTYYIPEMDSYVEGNQVGDINAGIDTTFHASSLNSNYCNALQSGAVTIGVDYHPSDNIALEYSGSYQNSSVQTSYMDVGSVLSTRESESYSNSLNLTAGNLGAHFSALSGHLNALKGLAGYEYDYSELNGKIGYNFKYKNLLVRPGIDANYATYSDEPYVDVTAQTGLLNGTAELGTVQGSVRFDYTAFAKLRLVAAWNQGYFYKPGKDFSSYQFAASYKSNENTLMRFVTSKSNSSPFVLDTYMNKKVSIQGMGNPQNGNQGMGLTVYKLGNENLAPLEMHLYEIGLRHHFLKNLTADFTLYYNKTDNFSQQIKSMSSLTEGEGAFNQNVTETIENSEVESHQVGITASLKYVLNDKFNVSAFGTFQRTYLQNYEISDSAFFTGLTGGVIDRSTIESSPVSISLMHTYTPSFYGGGSINYSPSDRWNINTSFYGYSKQKTFYRVRDEFKWLTIKAKISSNIKVSYKVNDWMSAYLNARNVLNNSSREFMFTDETGSSYLGGVNFTF